MRATRLIIAGVCIAAVLAVVALPASADAAYYRIINKEVQVEVHENWCLTPDSKRRLNIFRCDSRRSQLWEIRDWGWTRNVGTGDCLDATDWTYIRPLRTAECESNYPHMIWRHWQGGWFMRVGGFRLPSALLAKDACMEREFGQVHAVTVNRCGYPYGYNPGAEWFVLPAGR